MTTPPRSRFDELKDRAWEALVAGQFSAAIELCDESLVCAREAGDNDLVDCALCNRSAVLIEFGKPRETMVEMRRILMQSQVPDNLFLAAYNLAHAYEATKDYDKAVFYARIAHRHADSNEWPERRAACHNLTGNILLAQSKFDPARDEFQAALALLPHDCDHRRGIALDNLGYCDIVQGRHRQGFSSLFRAARILRRRGARAWLPVVEVTLCFAYLEIDRYRSAIRHAIRALAAAEATDNSDMKKNSLFLLGEAFKMAGDPLSARRHFARLQEEFYPGASGVADLLLLMNVKKLVNIKAL